MPKEKTPTEPAPDIQKDCWALYALQQMRPSKFIRVVGDIMRGRSYLTGNTDHRNSK